LNVLKGHKGKVTDAQFRSDGKIFTVGEDGTVRLWDTSGKQLAVFKGHKGKLDSPNVSPDGKLLVSVGQKIKPSACGIPLASSWSFSKGIKVMATLWLTLVRIASS
jgi:WD40 repeat protein